MDLSDMGPRARCVIRRIYRHCRNLEDRGFARAYTHDLIAAADDGNLSAHAVLRHFGL
jgi:hypothetical protein